MIRRCGRLGMFGALAVLLVPVGAFALPRSHGEGVEAVIKAEQEAIYLARRSKRRWSRHKRKRPRARTRAKVQRPAEQPQVSTRPLKRPRLTFEDVRITGQRPQAGAVYLFARRRTPIKSMVEERREYRREVLRTVFKD